MGNRAGKERIFDGSISQKIYIPKLFADFLLCAMPFILVMVLNMDLDYSLSRYL